MNPENMTRKEKLKMISVISKRDGYDEAVKYWLRYGSGISRKKFEEVA